MTACFSITHEDCPLSSDMCDSRCLLDDPHLERGED
jgi:hypothetical protein